MTPFRRLRRLAVLAMDGLADGVIAALPRRWRRPLGLVVPVLALPPGGGGPAVPAERGPVRLMLDPADVHTVDVPLPKGGLTGGPLGGLMGGFVDARGFVAMQAHRFMPLRPDLLDWDVVTLPSGIARVYMVRRTVLSAALATAARAGLTLAGVTAPVVGAGTTPEFLRFDAGRVRRRATAMAAVAGLFWLALPVPFAIAVWILDQQTANVEQKLGAVAKEARAVQDMRDRILFLSPDAASTALLLAQPGRAQVLDELALTLPDTVWLTDVTLRPDAVVLQGRAPDLADVLARVRAAGPFTDVRYTDPAGILPAVLPPPGPVRDFTLAVSLAVGRP
ncbi:PilN domain-containing protein [Azospirillum sp. B4]|uniref:PilN domain-containing protein n=1 Tax=Azospirillum sp. B4 TaxID=95605 RepID=UPI00034DEDDD|nr:PilN domain-containing protein [Azospirillum sp. B4]